jgi:hypothetical protein
LTTVGYPDWWDRDRNGYPDIEVLLETLFTPLISGIVITNWLPDEKTIQNTLESGSGFLRIYRTGGRINHEQKRDEPTVQLAALTKSRTASWDLIEFCRTAVLDQFQKAALVPGTLYKLQCAGELVGPQLIPEQMRMERLVPATFSLHTWRVEGKSFQQALGL